MSPDLPTTAGLILLSVRALPIFHLGLPGGGPFAHIGKTALALMYALLLSGVVQTPTTFDFLLLLRELTLGASLGVCARLALDSAAMAGHLVDQGSATPSDAEPFTKLYIALAAVLFFSFGGPLLLFTVLIQSYAVVPLTHSTAFGAPDLVARSTATAVSVALLLAAPVLVARAAVDLGLTSVGRASRMGAGILNAPTAQLLTLAMVLLGLGVFAGQFESHAVTAIEDLPRALKEGNVE